MKSNGMAVIENFVTEVHLGNVTFGNFLLNEYLEIYGDEFLYPYSKLTLPGLPVIGR